MEVKITIKVKDVEIRDLTVEEVKELRDILSKIVDKEIVKEKEYVPYPYYVEPYPNRWRYWEPYITWGGATTTSGNTEFENITVTYQSS